MTDFDKLIKEKAEQAEYSYKPSAWRQFQRKTGMGTSTARYWTVGISSALVVGGIVAFFGYRVNHIQSNIDSPQSVASVDTISQTVIPETDTKTSKKHVQGKDRLERAMDTVSETPRKMTTKPVANPPRYGRPLVIDVDTIKENVPTDEELKNGNSRLF